jgi:hypothetical protein
MTGDPIGTWLLPLQPILDPAGRVDWPRLVALQAELDIVLAAHPVGADLPAGAERSGRLQLVRREIPRPPRDD